jgi:4-amino-4-deoxy-L-arabinose transferase-like glycosyltransferase
VRHPPVNDPDIVWDVPPSPLDAGPPPGAGRDLLLLTVLCAALFGLGLGFAPLANPDEARYAEIPREMLATGDYVTPRLDGIVYFEKPPLTYWLVAGCLKIFGPGEAAARATPAILAALGVLLTYAAGRRLAGREAGFWAALVQATALLYFAHARILLTDMVVSVLICATLYCFLLGVREPPGRTRRLLFYGLYAAAAGATLAKGLIGFLLPGAVMFLWLLLFNQWRRLRPFYLPSGLLLFALIAVPWHVLVAQRNPEWARFYFVHEHWLRFTTTTHGRYEPWWFFLPVVLLGAFPWTGFLWPAVRTALPVRWAQRDTMADRAFPVLWAAFIFLFFSASQSKLVPYMLPVFPPLALLLGHFLATRLPRGDADGTRAGFMGFAVIAGLLGLALIAAGLRPGLLGNIANADELAQFAMLAGVFLLIGGLGTLALHRNGSIRTALGLMLGSTGAFAAVLVFAAPAIARPSTKDLARIVAQQVEPDDIVLHYHDYFHDFSYYAACTVGTVAYEGELELALDPDGQRRGLHVDEAGFRSLWAGPRQVYLVLRRSELPSLLAQPGFQARVLAETPKHVLLINRL